MTETDKIEQFEQFWKGTLSEAENQIFEEKMAADADFRAEALRHFEAMDALASRRNSSPRPALEAARDRYRRRAEASRPQFFRRPAVLFLLLGVLILSVYVFFRQQNDKSSPTAKPPTVQLGPDSLLRQNAPSPPGLPIENPPIAAEPAQKHTLAQSLYRRANIESELRGEATDGPIEQARAFLKNKKYADALAALQSVGDGDEAAIYLRGHCFFNLKKYAEAAGEFSKIADSGGYRERAQWFQFLSLLSQSPEKQDVVERLRKKICADAGHEFREQACALK